LIFKHFGFGIGTKLAGNIVFHRYPSVDLDIGPRIVAPIAFAFNTLEDRLSLGFSLKARLRGGVNHEFSIQDIGALNSSDANSTGPQLKDFIEGGFGYGADFGLLFTPIKTMAPTLGLSLTDIGGTAYTQIDVQGEAVSAPAPAQPSLNMGLSFKPIQTARNYILAAIEMHSLNQPYSFSKKLNLGVEWGFGEKIIKVQAGLHQGYLTGGLQFDLGLINLRLVTYSEELGAVAGSVEDRRYALQLKLLL
jgi:hypothetical protein